MHKSSIAVLFPAFMGGGAEAVCLWMLEALKNDHALTLFTLSDIDFTKLDTYYGTNLSESGIIARKPDFLEWLPRKMSYSLTHSLSLFTLRQHLLMRYFKRQSECFHLAISAFDEMDLGTRGIQYIHFPLFGNGRKSARHIVEYPDSSIRRVYRGVCRVFSGYSDEQMRKNITLSNSSWTASLVEEMYGIATRVVYPPVLSDFPHVPWSEKKDDFVCIGRMVTEKKLEVAISVIQKVRNCGHNVHLHIISGSSDRNYKTYLNKLFSDCSIWLHFHEELVRQDMCQLVSQFRYGIHTRKNEQFGISVAEMVNAGVIPFIPNEGGQTEIIGNKHELMFETEDDAVTRIIQVISDKQKQSEIYHSLAERRSLFSVQRFMTEINQIVLSTLQART